MNNSLPTPWADPTFADLSAYDEPAPAQAIDWLKHALRGKWLPEILVSLYFLSLWLPDSWPIPDLRWYMALGLVILAFLAQGARLNMCAASTF